MPWKLNAGDFATMIGAAAPSCERAGESRLGLGLRQSAWARSVQSHETSRYVIEGGWQRIGEPIWTPTSLNWAYCATTDA